MVLEVEDDRLVLVDIDNHLLLPSSLLLGLKRFAPNQTFFTWTLQTLRMWSWKPAVHPFSPPSPPSKPGQTWRTSPKKMWEKLLLLILFNNLKSHLLFLLYLLQLSEESGLPLHLRRKPSNNEYNTESPSTIPQAPFQGYLICWELLLLLHI